MNNYDKYIEAKKQQYMEFWQYLDYKKKDSVNELSEKDREEYERLKKVFKYVE